MELNHSFKLVAIFCENAVGLRQIRKFSIFYHRVKQIRSIVQRTLTIGGSITVQLVTNFISFDSTASMHTNNNQFSILGKSSLVKLQASRTVIYLPTVSILCLVWMGLHLYNEMPDYGRACTYIQVKATFMIKKSWTVNFCTNIQCWLFVFSMV